MTSARGSCPGVLHAAFAGALALASAAACAQARWITRVDLPVEVVRDSNPSLSATRPDPVTRYRTSPDVRSTYTDGADDIILSAGATLERNAPEVAMDRQDPRLRGEWRHGTPRSSMDLYALYEQSAYRSLGIAESTPFGVDGTRRQAAFGAAFTREISEAATMGLTARHDSTRFSTPGTADYGLTSAGAQYTRLLSDLSSWYLTLDLQRYRPEESTGLAAADSRSNGMLLGYRTGLLEGKLLVDVAAGQLRLGGPNNGSSWQSTVKVTYARPHTDFAFEASRRSSPLVSTSALGVITVVRLSSRTALGENASVVAEIARASTSGAPGAREDTVSLGYVRELSPTLQAAVRAERRARQQLGFGSAHGTRLAASLTYTHPDF